AKINPPIRPRREREALWSHLAAGNIDLVSTDHVAWSLSRKNNPDMLKNASGGPGLEALLPLLLKECRRRGVSLSMAARVLASNPARHFRISRTKGALTVGADADFSVVDPAHAPYRVADSRTVADWSVYEGIEMPQVKATYLRGECIWDGREVLAREGFGRLVRPHAGR
ncbi:MAG: amidohydrolase family protein, partial [Gammaproteobacteria bacterium]|nr:amidohydrolase family protein [Gammaproteobacteria bacterium]